jgi:hypothetical protein
VGCGRIKQHGVVTEFQLMNFRIHAPYSPKTKDSAVCVYTELAKIKMARLVAFATDTLAFSEKVIEGWGRRTF